LRCMGGLFFELRFLVMVSSLSRTALSLTLLPKSIPHHKLGWADLTKTKTEPTCDLVVVSNEGMGAGYVNEHSELPKILSR
jgi:hypothetical protein